MTDDRREILLRESESLVCVPVAGPPYQLPDGQWSVLSASLVGETQARVSVGQALLTNGNVQYVAYYGANREMTVAQRTLDSDTWVRQPLQEFVPHDGHNSVTMALDREGQLHVSGNMHNDPLVYFRTTEPGNVTTLTRIRSMINRSTEQSVTYPVFVHNRQGDLIFNFRDGVSGNGVTYYNIYDESTQSWSRLLDRPLFDGQGQCNSYPSDPVLGPDGRFHVVWVWRATGDAATNNHLSYARSVDLVNWETAQGAPLELPITPATGGVVVDPIPMYNGLLNGIPTIGFDAEKRVLISYYKLDEELNTQVYVARAKPGNGWTIVQVSSWVGRYFAHGTGTLPIALLISPVSVLPDGRLRLAYTYSSSTAQYSGTWILDPESLTPFTEAPLAEVLSHGRQPLPNLPREITTLRSDVRGMTVQIRCDSGESGSVAEKYFLRHEALPEAARDEPDPGPSQLLVYRVRSS